MTDRCLAPKCGRRLKTDESKARGYGPVCWSRINPAAPVIPAPGHAADPNQIPLPLENPVPMSTRFPRIFDVDAEEPRDVTFLRTHEGEIVERTSRGRWMITGSPDELDWLDVTEYAPLHEIVTSRTRDQLRDIACGVIGDHARDLSDVTVPNGHPSGLTNDDIAVLETLIGRATVTVNVEWPAGGEAAMRDREA